MNEQQFSELLKSVRQAGKIERGERKPSRIYRFSPVDTKKIRERTGLSQFQFSELVKVSVKTLQNWEQGRRQPRGPAVALLTILNNDPKHALKALHLTNQFT